MLARPVLSALATFAVVALAAGCSSQQREADPTPSATVPTETGPGDPDALPAYDAAETTSLGTLFKVDTLPGVVLTFGGGPIIGLTTPVIGELYALEPATGSNADFYLSEDKSEAYAVSIATKAGEGTAVGSDEITVTEFDPTTGETGRSATYDRPRTSADLPDQPLRANIKDVVGDLVVLDTRTNDYGAHATTVLDLGDGDGVWTEADQLPLAVTDDTVITTATSPTGTIEADTPGVTAYDLVTGDRVWEALPGASNVHLIDTTDDDVSLVWTTPEDSAATAQAGRLRLTTGEPRGRARAVGDSNWICTEGTEVVAVCTSGNVLLGWNLGRNRIDWLLPTDDRYAPELRMVDDGKVVGTLGERWVVMDAETGEDLATGVGSAPSAVNDTGGIFFDQGEALWVPEVGAIEDDDASATPAP